MRSTSAYELTTTANQRGAVVINDAMEDADEDDIPMLNEA
jgi:hypothetical protein